MEFASDRRRDGSGRSPDDNLLRFESQDYNIDRAFQFIFKLVEAYPEVPSLKMWDQAMLVTKGVGGRIIKQKTVIDKLKKTGLPMFKNLELNLPGDSCRMYKHQHPYLLVSKDSAMEQLASPRYLRWGSCST